ncbi:MAG: hypothetical protein GY765_21625 [bacterium]|nr:hypothetical protein [bacterium]
MMKNNVFVELTDENVALLNQKIDEISGILSGLINLSPANTESDAATLNPVEIDKDYQLAISLRKVGTRMRHLVEKVEDTYLAAGAEAYAAAKTFLTPSKPSGTAPVAVTDDMETEYIYRIGNNKKARRPEGRDKSKADKTKQKGFVSFLVIAPSFFTPYADN